VQSFAVRIALASPIVLTDGYALDALLAHQLYEAGKTAADLDAVLRRDGIVHAASWFFAEAGQHGVARWPVVRTQRAGDALNPALVRTGPKTRPGILKVDNKRGVAANLLSPMKAVATPAIWAFGHGEPGFVRQLLSGLAHVGRKRAAGLGAVDRIEVTPVEGWTDIGVMDPDRQPMRAVPVEAWRGNDAPLGAYTLTFPRYVQNPHPCVYPPAVFVAADRLAEWASPAREETA
jgi:hypothetical protein